MTCDLRSDIWQAEDSDLAKRCFRAVVGAGLAMEECLETYFVKRVRDFYPIYSVDYRERISRIYDKLRSAENFILTGRLGMFNYNN